MGKVMMWSSWTASECGEKTVGEGKFLQPMGEKQGILDRIFRAQGPESWIVCVYVCCVSLRQQVDDSKGSIG